MAKKVSRAKTPVKTTAKAKAKVKAPAKTTAKVKAKTRVEAPVSVPEPASPFALFPDSFPEVLTSVGNLVPAMKKAFGEVAKATTDLRKQFPHDAELTTQQRKRLIGAGAKNYGFIVKSWETAEARPAYRPPGFSVPDMAETLANIEQARQLLAVIDQMRQLVDDFLLSSGDIAYRDALRVYGNLRELARMKNPGAQALFDQLKKFFKRRRNTGAEPTEHELDVDFHNVLHGKSDGEFIIKNETPRMTGGVHEVVDNVRKRGKRGAKMEVKEEEE